MPEYLSPGVYVEEISTGPVPIEGVSTSTAAMLGQTERGPEYPKLITSWLQFQRWYGSYIPESYLAYAVQGFFDNGGQRVFIGRIIENTATATAGAAGDLNLTAWGRGTWGNNVMVKISTAGNKNPTQFRVSLIYFSPKNLPPNFPTIVDPFSTKPEDLTNKDRREPDVIEDFDNLTVQIGASNNAVTVINSNSKLVQAFWANDTPAQPAPTPNFAQLGTNGTPGAAINAGTFDGDTNPIGGLPDDLLGRGRGLAAMEMIDEISILLVPDEVRSMREISTAVLNQCQKLKDRFAIFSVDQGSNTGVGVIDDSSYGAIYYPWIRVYDPSANETLLIPPSGHIAGIYARTDIERGVHKAPANEVVRGARDLEFPVPKGDQDILNPKGINAIRDFRTDGRGIRVWGARTMSSDGQWKYINVRRLFLFVEESIDEGTQWVVFEPNDEPLWARVRRSVTNFLITVWRNGALMGVTQEEAFFVKCDRTTMTQDDIDNGRLICYIGIAPVKPAEFVIFRISQKTLEAQQ